MLKRTIDIIFSIVGIILFSPLLVFISIFILLDSKGPVLFKQKRVGLKNKDFVIYKFRTMRIDSETRDKLTIGNKDNRITRVGYYLRKFKLDELPQLFNVLIGNMSFVGPRPELRYFVSKYSKEDLMVLSVKPGITCTASIQFKNEPEILKSQSNPETYYTEIILPKKNALNIKYIKEQNSFKDISIIFKTIIVLIFNRK